MKQSNKHKTELTFNTEVGNIQQNFLIPTWKTYDG